MNHVQHIAYPLTLHLLYKAFQELAQYAFDPSMWFQFRTRANTRPPSRGESTASALEAKLDGIEGRIDQLLAGMEENLKQGNPPSNDSQSK